MATRRYTKGIDLIEAQFKRIKDTRMTFLAAHEDLVDQSRADMVELTSGGIKQVDLTALGHPFGRGIRLDQARNLRLSGMPANQIPALWTKTGKRRGYQALTKTDLAAARKRGFRSLGVSVPLLPINRQSSNLQRAIRKTKVTGKGIQSFAIGPKGVRYAKYVLAPGGTKYMVGRGFLKEARSRWKARSHAFIMWFVRHQRTLPY